MESGAGPGDNMTRRFDVCNGDADGLCAVHQWRLHEPAPATLVTGLKREIELLERVEAGAGDEVLVCDVSLARNRAAVLRLLDRGARIRYFDHHAASPAFSHPAFEAHIDTAADVCTSVIVDRAIGGRFRGWAVVGAFGDNLVRVAEGLAASIGLRDDEVAGLRRLGEAINYNAYGEDASEVLVPPAQLFERMARYRDPRDMLAWEPLVGMLDERRCDDLDRARLIAPRSERVRTGVLVLPDAPWSRRVVGALANELAHRVPDRAHALLVPSRAGGWSVSVRAPISAHAGAGALCSRFGGGGREGAGGIDRLAPSEFDRFVGEFESAQWGTAR